MTALERLRAKDTSHDIVEVNPADVLEIGRSVKEPDRRVREMVIGVELAGDVRRVWIPREHLIHLLAQVQDG